MKSINISEFKAKCRAILERIARTGERVTILKRGIDPVWDSYPKRDW